MTANDAKLVEAGASAPPSAAAVPVASAAPPAASLPVAPGDIESVARNELRQLVIRLKGKGEAIVDARVARCFPWSLPGQYVSLRTKEGKEIALFKTLEELDGAGRRIVEEELADKTFNPKILRVIDYRNEFGVVSMSAETDRGKVSFQIRSRDDIRHLSPTRALFRDADGNTYELADLAALDPVSQKWLGEYF
jgi:catechol 2,3-dioxygenase-like lactoylglutathione lyase family enzyme